MSQTQQEQARRARADRRRQALLEQNVTDHRTSPERGMDVLGAVWRVTQAAFAVAGLPIEMTARAQRPGRVRRDVPELL